VIFESSRRTPPIEEFANGFGKFGQAEGRKIADDVPDELDLFSRELATAK
jgi:hypothetical protein